jgi:hypothetical protein
MAFPHLMAFPPQVRVEFEWRHDTNLYTQSQLNRRNMGRYPYLCRQERYPPRTGVFDAEIKSM